MFKVPNAYVVAHCPADATKGSAPDSYALSFDTNTGRVTLEYVAKSEEERKTLDAALASGGKVTAGYDGGRVVSVLPRP